MSMRRIAVIVGSDSDLSQCFKGLEVLAAAEAAGQIEVTGVHTMSVHRNMKELFPYLRERHNLGNLDVIIAAAGWAAHLPGMIDARLRYHHRNDKIVVIGVAMEDPRNNVHTLAAQLAISEVPGTQVVYSVPMTRRFFWFMSQRYLKNIVLEFMFRFPGPNPGDLVGSAGFIQACLFAVNGVLPTVSLPKPKPTAKRTLEEALTFVQAAKTKA